MAKFLENYLKFILFVFNIVICMICLVKSSTSKMKLGEHYLIMNPKSNFDAGFQHGKLAKNKIQEYFNISYELKQLRMFVTKSVEGKHVFDKLINTNKLHFPDLFEEMEGIARGASVDIKDVWIMNLLQEISGAYSNYAFTRKKVKCSDIYFKYTENNTEHIVHGHNEDWSDEIKPYVYFLSFQFTSNEIEKLSSVKPIAGFTYPGVLLGQATSFNKKGMYFAINSLYPYPLNPVGRALGFVSRRTIETNNIEELIKGNVTYGMSVNVVLFNNKHSKSKINENNNSEFLEQIEEYIGLSKDYIQEETKILANYEISPFNVSIKYINSGNYSHFNSYKRLEVDQHDDNNSSYLRQKYVDSLPEPKSYLDVVNTLGSYPEVYKNITLMTYVFDTRKENIYMWVSSNPSTTEPKYIWNIHSFWLNHD